MSEEVKLKLLSEHVKNLTNVIEKQRKRLDSLEIEPRKMKNFKLAVNYN